MYKRLIDYINKNGILTDCQYGFRSKSSTNHAIIKLLDKITKAIEKNEFTVGIFLDLSKAFDTVNHNILLKNSIFMVFVANVMLGLKINSPIENELLNIITQGQQKRYFLVGSNKDLFLDRCYLIFTIHQ